KGKTNKGVWLATGTLPGIPDLFLGFSDNTMKCREIGGKRVYDADWGVYFQVNYEFEFKEDNWKTPALNQGMNQLVSGVKQPIVIGNANVSAPQCLAADGTWSSSVTPNYLLFQPYRQIDFGPLNIPWQIFVSGPSG